jgi:hypothetical protein
MAILRTEGSKWDRRRKTKCKKCNNHHHPHHHHNNKQQLPIGNCPLKQEIPGMSTTLQEAPMT